jgi:phenylpropionate dioxygenase-like ring-hydroxylating dioxygenase large terminal subunit
MFLRNAWYMAAWAADISTSPLARRICNEPVVIYRDRQGVVGALRDACCHRGAPLSIGRVTDAGLECGYHGLVFDRSGGCVHIPGQDHIPSKVKVVSYPVVEQDSIVWIWIGDASAADASSIPSYPFHGDPKWPSKTQTYPVRANYMLLIDNLMDLTHVAYVHVSTIGGNPTAHVQAEMDTSTTARGITMTRWLLNSLPPPTYRKAVPELPERIDRWQEFEYIAPGVVLQYTGAVGATANARNGGSREGGFALRIFHGITPETETTCYYFWSAANGYRQNEPVATAELFKEIDEAFTEDKVVVELQQQRLQEFGEDELVQIRSDRARMSMRRSLAVRLKSASELADVATEKT